MKNQFVLPILALSGAAFAGSLLAPMKLVINGKTVPGKTAEVGGQTYVPLSALKAAGAYTSMSGGTLSINWGPAGGANQQAAVEGGVGDWLFDGVWRFKVTKVVSMGADSRGWKVSVELKNGTRANQLALAGTGFDSLPLVMSDGNSLTPDNITEIRDPGVDQGASINVDLIYKDEQFGTRTPDRLILRMNPDDATKSYLKSVGVSFGAADPSFRVSVKAKG